MDHRIVEEHVRREPDGSYSNMGVAVFSPQLRDQPHRDALCYFCDEGSATTFFPLDETKLIGFGGKGFTLGGPLATCSACAAWFLNGDDHELVEPQRAREIARWASIDDSPITASEVQGFLDETTAVLSAFHDAAGEPVTMRT